MMPDAVGSQYEVCEDAPLNDEEMSAPTNGISKS
jgi:hypothetical protein